MRWGIIFTVTVALGIIFLLLLRNNNSPFVTPETISPTIFATGIPTGEPTSASTTNKTINALREPVAGFRERVTKKPFGIFVTPQNSPVQPERFTGYHTGSDAEYGDVLTDVPVRAVQNGTVAYSGFVSGYGGVTILSGEINNSPVRFLYGHLNPRQLLSVGTKVSAEQQIGILGKGFSRETDNERRHLHFAIIVGEIIDFRGYVQEKTILNRWLNPLSFDYSITK